MKNEQQNNQTKKQEPAKDAGNNKQAQTNTSIGKDGRIGKAHDDNDWSDNDNNNRNVKINQRGTDEPIVEPEIDAPIYDPEKTEKKIPRMETNKEKK